MYILATYFNTWDIGRICLSYTVLYRTFCELLILAKFDPNTVQYSIVSNCNDTYIYIRLVHFVCVRRHFCGFYRFNTFTFH